MSLLLKKYMQIIERLNCSEFKPKRIFLLDLLLLKDQSREGSEVAI